MSDTPRTDEANKQYQVDVYDNPKGYCVTEPVHASFARDLEREIRQLEVAIYDLKTENNKLRKDLDETTQLNQAVSMLAGLPTAREMDTLVKDGKRLDWILSDAGGFWLSAREDIDKEMEESQ